MTRLTLADLEAGYEHDSHDGCDGWLGWGYLIERREAMSTEPGRRAVHKADKRLLAEANALGWTSEDLFRWANSKLGRWYGEDARNGVDLDIAVRRYLSADALAGVIA